LNGVTPAAGCRPIFTPKSFTLQLCGKAEKLRLNSTTSGTADAFRRGQLLCVGLLALLAVYVVQTLLGHVHGGPTDPATMVYNALLVLAAAACAARGLTATEERVPWLLLGLAIGLWACGDLYYTFFFSGVDEVPFPSVADAFYLSFYPVAYAALGILLRGRIRQFQGSLWLDGIIGGLVVSAIGAAVVFDAVLTTTGGSKLVIWTNLAYPLFDLLLFALLVGVLALTGWRLDRTWVLIACGFASFGVADSLYLYQTAAGTYVEGRLVDVGWVLATVLLACAAWQPVRKIEEARNEGWQVLTLPTVFAFVGLGLLVYDHFRPLSPLALALASASVAAVILRAVFTFRERLRLLELSRHEALTDALTGLGNRRRFMRDIEAELGDIDESRPVVLVLLDLDGFKAYNDTFGHPAGDSLLTRLAANLDLAVRGLGRAYRMGGDEFCVVGSAAHDNGAALMDASAAALREEGEGFLVTCSYGSVLLPEEADQISNALRIADGRMYLHKNRHRPSAGRQSIDVLLRALHERDSDLGKHQVDVADLAEAVGRRLRVPADQLETLRQAAELHDIGKIAIPERILSKPGPLTDPEWEFVRRHTVIGERILEAAPALGPAAKLVRSTHEWFDGTGYPDALAGQQIPLGARIIAVCDSFDAMTKERFNAPALTFDEAARELFRCAGTQFDPEVVEAFLAVQSELRAELVA
jgi:two-component system cell cycle response regulator